MTNDHLLYSITTMPKWFNHNFIVVKLNVVIKSTFLFKNLKIINNTILF